MILLKQINQIKGIASGQANNVQIGFRTSESGNRISIYKRMWWCPVCLSECAAYFLHLLSLSFDFVIDCNYLSGPQNFIRHSGGVYGIQSQKSIELDEK